MFGKAVVHRLIVYFIYSILWFTGSVSITAESPHVIHLHLCIPEETAELLQQQQS